jgi:DNA-binding beta-propeller fold protein YncE
VTTVPASRKEDPLEELLRRNGRTHRIRKLIDCAAAALAVIALVVGLLASNAKHTPPRPAPAIPMMAYLVGGGDGSGVGGALSEPGSVLPVDLATGLASRPIGLGVPGPLGGVLVAPNGRTVYVATQAGDVVPVDVAKHTAESPIRIGGNPSDMLMSPNGRTGYVFEYPRGIATVNLVTRRPGRVIKIPEPGAFALTPNGKTLYVVTWHGQEVIPVDTATLQTGTPIQTGDYNDVGSARLVVAPDGRRVYLLSGKPGIPGQVLTPIDVATGAVLPSIVVSASALGAAPTISPDSRSAYLDTGYGIMAVDLTTGRIRWTLNLGGPDVAYQAVVSPDSRTVYITGNGYALDPTSAANGSQGAPVLFGWSPFEVAFSPGGELYVLGIRVGAMSSALIGFDPSTGAVLPPISLPQVTNGPSLYNMVLGA